MALSHDKSNTCGLLNWRDRMFSCDHCILMFLSFAQNYAKIGKQVGQTLTRNTYKLYLKILNILFKTIKLARRRCVGVSVVDKYPQRIEI